MKQEYLLEVENIRNLIKYLASTKGMSLVDLKNLINKKYNKFDSADNLRRKLRVSTLRANELCEIIDTLGYKIVIKEK